MSGAESRDIVDTLHQMELRMAERMVRVETELRGWRKESEALSRADAELAKQVVELRDRCNRQVLAMAVVGLLALGNLGTKLVTFF